MIKKTFFIKTYNLNIYLILFSLLTGFIGWSLNFLSNSIDLSLPISFDFSQINFFLSLGSHYSYNAMIGILFILFSSIMIEVLNRVRFDSFLNYLKSIYHTFKLRNFLIQREITRDAKTIENQVIAPINQINDSFNRCARKSVIDIQNDEVKVFIKVPRDQQGQKLLGDMISHLKDEIASQHPDYYFSAPNRLRNNLWVIGKKR
ncbi:MAG: hypothetical protein KH229_04520 [Streptococcus parasanguinis]|uniref:hypothetical protein n=1 Tax=Streptococcus sp. GS001 TaxID=2766953 RepID=UPI001F2C9272|nr:hypothetical protein [Streptococcus sp. GS001]MBS6718584.1 hypothetical protein [Streptococcus parasanguinis]MCF4964915.1 hypothetical protein [Streptococcus sp. GS001]